MLYDLTIYVCVWYSYKNSDYFSDCMNKFVCVMGIMCVHCEVGTEFLNNTCIYACICLYKFLIPKC
jgi:hypothetical protein